MSKDLEIDNYMDYVASRNRLAQHLKQVGAPQVGIFWFVQEPGQAPLILANRVFVQLAKAEGTYLRCFADHDSEWRNLKRNGRGTALMSCLNDSGPADWPRGRVVLNTVTKRFEVYLDQQLHSPQFEAMILEHFHLPDTGTTFAVDPGYTGASFLIGPDGPRKRSL